jgi:exonuclease SbcC
MQHSLQVEQKTLAQQEKSAEKLSEVPCGDSFPTFKFIKDSHLDRQRIDSQRQRVEDLTRQVVSTREALDTAKLADIDSKIGKYQDILKKESELQVQLVKVEATLSGGEKDIEHNNQRCNEAVVRLGDLRMRVVAGDMADELSKAKKDVKALNTQLNTLDSRRLSLVESAARTKGQIERAEEEKDKYSELKNKWRLYEHMMSALSKRGIPSQIMHRLLPRINIEISKILQGVVDFTVSLEVDTESNAMDIYIDYGDSRRIIELASGMEKMIASLAIRVALINVSSLPKTDMFIIDEGFGTLDESNIAACGRLLESLKQWFRIIIVISHVDGIKDAADSIIELTRHGKDSCVDYT